MSVIATSSSGTLETDYAEEPMQARRRLVPIAVQNVTVGQLDCLGAEGAEAEALPMYPVSEGL
jgi:hypothetical protein